VDLPPLTYLTVDSMSEGVGRSQVVPYVVRLAQRGVDVTLHSFEKQSPDPQVGERLAAAGVRWRPHPFRGGGAAAGVGRVAQGAALVRGAPLVHARSDLAAASCMASGRRCWLWDMRALWREERIAAGLLAPGSPQERAMRKVEDAAAHRSRGIITLSAAAVEILRERYGEAVAGKCRVITTCVDLDRFALSPPPPTDPLRLLLAGTLSPVYDVAGMVRLVARLRARGGRPVTLTVLTPDPGPWRSELEEVGAVTGWVDAADMPAEVSAHHVGLSMRNLDVSNRAATPTKLGEFLAAGRPVVVSPGLGDMDRVVADHDCGVVVDDRSDDGLDRAAAEIERLSEDPGTAARCRAAALAYFDLEKGVDQLLAAYGDARR